MLTKTLYNGPNPFMGSGGMTDQLGHPGNPAPPWPGWAAASLPPPSLPVPEG